MYKNGGLKNIFRVVLIIIGTMFSISNLAMEVVTPTTQCCNQSNNDNCLSQSEQNFTEEFNNILNEKSMGDVVFSEILQALVDIPHYQQIVTLCKSLTCANQLYVCTVLLTLNTLESTFPLDSQKQLTAAAEIKEVEETIKNLFRDVDLLRIKKESPESYIFLIKILNTFSLKYGLDCGAKYRAFLLMDLCDKWPCKKEMIDNGSDLKTSLINKIRQLMNASPHCNIVLPNMHLLIPEELLHVYAIASFVYKQERSMIQNEVQQRPIIHKRIQDFLHSPLLQKIKIKDYKLHEILLENLTQIATWYGITISIHDPILDKPLNKIVQWCDNINDRIVSVLCSKVINAVNKSVTRCRQYIDRNINTKYTVKLVDLPDLEGERGDLLVRCQAILLGYRLSKCPAETYHLSDDSHKCSIDTLFGKKYVCIEYGERIPYREIIPFFKWHHSNKRFYSNGSNVVQICVYNEDFIRRYSSGCNYDQKRLTLLIDNPEEVVDENNKYFIYALYNSFVSEHDLSKRRENIKGGILYQIALPFLDNFSLTQLRFLYGILKNRSEDFLQKNNNGQLCITKDILSFVMKDIQKLQESVHDERTQKYCKKLCIESLAIQLRDKPYITLQDIYNAVSALTCNMQGMSDYFSDKEEHLRLIELVFKNYATRNSVKMHDIEKGMRSNLCMTTLSTGVQTIVYDYINSWKMKERFLCSRHFDRHRKEVLYYLDEKTKQEIIKNNKLSKQTFVHWKSFTTQKKQEKIRQKQLEKEQHEAQQKQQYIESLKQKAQTKASYRNLWKQFANPHGYGDPVEAS